MGVEMTVGRVTMEMSTRTLIKARDQVQKRAEMSMGKLLKGLIIFVLILNVLLSLVAVFLLKKVIISQY